MLEIFPFAVSEPHAKTKASNRNVNHQNPVPTPKNSAFSHSELLLDGGLVGDGCQGLGAVLLEGDLSCLTGQGGLSLHLDSRALRLCLGLQRSVLLDSAQETLSGSGRLDVLDAEVDALLDVSVLDLLVNDDTDGGLGDVVHDTGLAVVDFVGHTVIRRIYVRNSHSRRGISIAGPVCMVNLPLLDSTVCLDVHDVADPKI